jgi:hypothetical protein
MTKNEFRKVIKPEVEHCKPKENINIFDFIENKTLRKNLEKSYKETVFVKNLGDKLSINFTDAHPLNEIQILHYASIYEAIIDYVLENYYKDEIACLLKERILKDTDVCKSIEIKCLADSENLYLCKAKIIKKKLYQIKFEHRIKKAVDLGLVDSSSQADIVKLYDYRNHIHIIKASTNKHIFTKQLVSTFCNEITLKNFCTIMKNSIPNPL